MKLKYRFLRLIYLNYKNNPDKICIEKGSEKLSYKEFWDLCNKFSAFLSHYSKNKTPVVCVFEQRNFIDYVSIIGTLISGGYYIPINKATPPKKIGAIIKSTGANFFVNESLQNLNFKKTQAISFLDIKNFNINVKKNLVSKIAYILFTSGTTGKPKGVVIQKKSLENYVKWITDKIKLDNNSICSQIPSIGFDLSVADIYLSLCSGAKLVIPDSIDNIFPARWIKKKKISHIICTPSLIDYIIASNQLNKSNFKDVKLVFFCGEPLYESHVKKLFKANKNIKIINAYGPTEATCSMTCCDINYRNYKNKSINTMSLGLPIRGMGIRLFNKSLVNNKEVGEILIHGIQLASKYFKQDILTKKKFFYINGIRYYKTGDLGFYKHKNLFFFARDDKQIKIRGFRVELNEIDHFINKFGYSVCKSIFFKKKIISFIKRPKIDNVKLINYLKTKLEDYKIPYKIIKINKFPLNKNGKIDTIKLTQYI